MASERQAMGILHRTFSPAYVLHHYLKGPGSNCAKALTGTALLIVCVSLLLAAPAAAQNTILDGSGSPVTVTGTYTVPLGFQTLTLGTINNQGNILVSSGGGLDAHLTLQADTTLEGGGKVTLANSGGGGTSYIDGTHVLTNVDNTIQGAGQIGDSTFGFPTLINESGGTINANVSGQQLAINGVFVANTGLLEASGGGTLTLTNGTIVANQGGTILANGGTVFLAGTTIVGGTLNNAGGPGSYLGTIDTKATLDGSTSAGPVTIQGTFTVGGNQTSVLGIINNQGNIQGGTLTLAGDTTLQGGGTVTMSGDLDGTHVLTNVDNTIQGKGQIGDSTFGFPTLINESGGTINANVSGQTLGVDGIAVINAGLMEGTAGGKLQLFNGTTVNNIGGTIAADGGTVEMDDTTITGGTIKALNGGTMWFANPTIVGGTLINAGGYLGTIDSSATLDGSTGFGAVTIQGTLTFGGFHSSVTGAINNQGNIQDGAHLTLAGDTTLQGGGTLTLGGSGSSFLDGTHVLTNVGNTIQGAGQIGDSTNGFPTLINQAGGTIDANISGKDLTIFGVLTSNAGLMEATGGGVLNLDGSPLTNGGTVKVDTVSGLLINAPFTQTAGKTQVDGFLIASQGENVSGGTVLGHGTIYGNVTMIGGTMQPGGATAPGTLTINGDYAQSTATFDELIGATGNGLLFINGTSTLGPGALLNIDLLDGFTPFVGETFTLMDFLTGSGIFANAPSTGFEMDGFNWTIAYNASSIVLDAGSVVSGGGGGGTTSTPEPNSLILLCAGLTALALWRKRAGAPI